MKHQIYKNNWFNDDERKWAKESLIERSEDGYVPSEEEIEDEMYRLAELDWYDLREYLTKYLESHTMVALETIGTWRGSFEGYKIVDTFSNFIDTLDGCDYISIYDEDGKLMVEGVHHDGRNVFELKTLTSKGEDLVRNGNDNYKALNTNFYSKKTNFWKYVMG